MKADAFAEPARAAKRKRTDRAAQKKVTDKVKDHAWEQYTKLPVDRELPINLLAMDRDRNKGPIPKLEDTGAVSYYEDIIQRPPLDEHRVLVWEGNLTGIICAPSPLACCRGTGYFLGGNTPYVP